MTLTARQFLARGPTMGAAEEAAFFATIRARNGTFKTTTTSRMLEIDAALAEHLVKQGRSRPDVLDVAVSSGVTTLDLRTALLSRHLEPQIVATDMLLEGQIVSLGPRVRVLVDNTGHPLQYDIMGLALPAWQRRLTAALGYGLVTSLLARTVARHLEKNPLAGERVKLVTPRLWTATGLELIEDDINRCNGQLQGRFDLVRAANILNRAYFEEVALSRMATNLLSYLKGQGGLLLVNRTHNDASNHGTLFMLEADRLLPVQRFGSGSEVEGLIVALRR